MTRQVDSAQTKQPAGAKRIVAAIQSIHETQKAQIEAIEQIAQ